MLLELAQWLAKDIRAFNVFSYITLRAVLACLTALVISFVVLFILRTIGSRAAKREELAA